MPPVKLIQEEEEEKKYVTLDSTCLSWQDSLTRIKWNRERLHGVDPTGGEGDWEEDMEAQGENLSGVPVV